MTWPSHDLTPQQTSRHQNTSLQSTETSPPWNGRRLVHSKEMVWASRWSVALRAFYRQILSLTYRFFLWNFRPRLVRALLVYKLGIWTCNLQWMGPQVTCAHQKEPLAPKIHCLDLNKQPFRLGTGGDRGFRGGDRGLGTYTWRCSTMNKQPLGWELGGTGVLGVGTGDWGLIHGDVVQWTNNHLGWELGGLGF